MRLSSEAETVSSNLRKAVAYVRMSTERQVYSTKNQLDAIREYASSHGITIIAIYEDAGKSGLTRKGRPGLSQLLNDVQQQPDFTLILVFDVSRWGRFQDIDESAHYEYVCRTNGVDVAYCAENFLNDGTPYAAIIKALKRVAAADYSRELSNKVFAAQCRMVRMGFKTGGPPGYGLRRLLLNSDGSVVRALETGEWKYVQTQRVVLAPGPADEISVVNQIYTWYVDGIGDRRIAAVLNSESVPSEAGGPWTADLVRGMLRNEKYIGNIVFNRRSFKLRKCSVQNPPEEWVRCDAAFAGIVPPTLFKAAQDERARRYRRYSKEELLDLLKRIHDRHGRVTSTLIDADADAPTARLIARHFGTLFEAYDLAGIPTPRNNKFLESRAKNYSLRSSILSEVQTHIELAGGRSEVGLEPYTLRVNGGLKLSIRVIRCGHDNAHDYYRWRIPKHMASGVDFVLAAQLDKWNTHIVRYFLLDAVTVTKNMAFTERTVGQYLGFARDELGEFFATSNVDFCSHV